MKATLKMSISFLALSSSRKKFQENKIVNDRSEGSMRRKRWFQHDSKQSTGKTSRPDILQISQSSIPTDVQDNLSITEEAFLFDISAFRASHPDKQLPVHFQMANERIKAGGELMGNDLEKMTHKQSFLQANYVINDPLAQYINIRRVFLDHVSSDHSCTKTASELEQTFIKDLTKDSINHGKILWVTVEEPSYRMHTSSAITALVKDSQGTLSSLAMYNILPPRANTRDVEKYLPVGTRIGIKEPFFKCFLSGYLGLRVDNPGNLEIEDSDSMLPDPRAQFPELNDKDSLQDYYGPIEIREAGKKGRGFFLTKDVQEGIDGLHLHIIPRFSSLLIAFPFLTAFSMFHKVRKIFLIIDCVSFSYCFFYVP
jgi:hypothetical protein